MILLPCDEAYAWDYLSILYVKQDNGMPVGSEITRVEVFLAQQLRDFIVILSSPPFKRLIAANQRIFDAIELAHQNKISAREVQQINMLRFKAKKALQAKFWPHSVMCERKTRLTKRR